MGGMLIFLSMSVHLKISNRCNFMQNIPAKVKHNTTYLKMKVVTIIRGKNLVFLTTFLAFCVCGLVISK
jgi:hypothetical protein